MNRALNDTILIHCVSEITSPFLYLLQPSQMSSNFANSRHKQTPGNLKQTNIQAATSRFICLYCII